MTRLFGNPHHMCKGPGFKSRQSGASNVRSVCTVTVASLCQYSLILSDHIHPWDTLAVCWFVRQRRHKQAHCQSTIMFGEFLLNAHLDVERIVSVSMVQDAHSMLLDVQQPTNDNNASVFVHWHTARFWSLMVWFKHCCCLVGVFLGEGCCLFAFI